MKKIMNKINFAVIAMMVSVPAFADPMCDLIGRMKGVFGLLRTLAFVGAGFYIAGWAWDYIKNAGGDKGFSVEDVKKKGIGLLVGFTLFFIIGLVLSFLLSATGQTTLGCAEITGQW